MGEGHTAQVPPQKATVSPLCTPAAFIALCTLPTAASSSFHVIFFTSGSKPTAGAGSCICIIATSSPLALTCRSWFSAQLSDDCWNQSGLSAGFADSSTYGQTPPLLPMTPSKSHTADQKSLRREMDHLYRSA